MMLNTIGQRKTELALQLSTLFTADEAFKIGLVDKVVGTSEECMTSAHEMVANLANIPSEVNT